MLGYDFDRQRPIDNFIVDFYCKDLQLAIEVDGFSHEVEGAFDKDVIRQERLESLGVKFLRFEDSEVKKDMNNVLRTIEGWIKEYEQSYTHPQPLQGGEFYE
jgi:very-short-patch-repair endonuclease